MGRPDDMECTSDVLSWNGLSWGWLLEDMRSVGEPVSYTCRAPRGGLYCRGWLRVGVVACRCGSGRWSVSHGSASVFVAR